MKKEVTRRQMISRTAFALSGAVGVGLLHGRGSASAAETAPAAPHPANGAHADCNCTSAAPGRAQVADFPYERHLPAGYRLDAAAIREVAYNGYYAGGCCHGSYSALVGHLASTAGAPFNLLPIDFGKFGAGGIAGYGSICGAVLGGVLVINMAVSNAAARGAMMTDLMRWYEGFAFPAYTPLAVNAGETGLTLSFAAKDLARLQVVPHSHVCHASVSGWCAANHVSATGSDKKARCSRLTADVAGKVAEMINAYLSSGAYSPGAIDAASSSCLGCHGPTTTARPVASGMECGACHTDEQVDHPL